MRHLPYGSWPSPLAAVELTRGAIKLSAGIVDDGCEYWAQARPDQAGRISLWRRDSDAVLTELTPQANVRTGVNEYGGGAWTVAGGLVAYSNWPQGSVHLIRPEGSHQLLAAGTGMRYAGLSLHPEHGVLLAVREDHRQSGPPAQTIVALALDSDNPDGGHVLARGADFYAHPSLSMQGRLAWCQWNLPDMPWDRADILVADLDNLATATVVAGDPKVSALYPAWAPDGALIYLSDISGFWNFHRWQDGTDRPLNRADADFCGPLWVLDPVSYTIIDAHHLGCSWTTAGFDRLGVLSFDDTGRSDLTELHCDAVTIQLAGSGPSALARFGYADRPAELVSLDWASGIATTRLSEAPPPPPDLAISAAEPFEWSGAAGTVHGWYYPPRNVDCAGLPDERPPVQVWSHGGPTGFARPEFNLALQFWTSRGIGILDVNYSGSAGYGRAYRARLNGHWGILDVSDCVAGVEALAAAGLADRDRLSIRGGSAGGFTTLAALTFSDVFAAGISLYGIGDLEMLATDTHKFESRYLDGLVAPYPAGRQIYRDRSPIHHLDQLSCPMLILQGADDTVVPPNQAEAMAAAVRAKGLAATLHIFSGEGHGFRRAETIIAVAEEALAFLGEVHGFTPA
jgi:dipeptidyl aminopeptidase/acylaminoacyl peptidase